MGETMGDITSTAAVVSTPKGRSIEELLADVCDLLLESETKGQAAGVALTELIPPPGLMVQPTNAEEKFMRAEKLVMESRSAVTKAAYALEQLKSMMGHLEGNVAFLANASALIAESEQATLRLERSLSTLSNGLSNKGGKKGMTTADLESWNLATRVTSPEKQKRPRSAASGASSVIGSVREASMDVSAILPVATKGGPEEEPTTFLDSQTLNMALSTTEPFDINARTTGFNTTGFTEKNSPRSECMYSVRSRGTAEELNEERLVGNYLMDLQPDCLAAAQRQPLLAADSVCTEASYEERLLNWLDLEPQFYSLSSRPSSIGPMQSVRTEGSRDERIVAAYDLFSLTLDDVAQKVYSEREVSLKVSGDGELQAILKMTGDDGQAKYVVYLDGQLDFQTGDDGAYEFGLQNMDDHFLLEDLAGSDGMKFIAVKIGDKTYLKTTDGQFVAVDMDTGLATTSSEPGLEVDVAVSVSRKLVKDSDGILALQKGGEGSKFRMLRKQSSGLFKLEGLPGAEDMDLVFNRQDGRVFLKTTSGEFVAFDADAGTVRRSDTLPLIEVDTGGGDEDAQNLLASVMIREEELKGPEMPDLPQRPDFEEEEQKFEKSARQADPIPVILEDSDDEVPRRRGGRRKREERCTSS
jgi:hypothetical protein